LADSPISFTRGIADSPLQKLHSPFLDKANIQLYVKRDDLIHPQFGGNKWRKLKYNLIHARNNHFDTLLTFGGAWSNHIYATAAAGKHFGFKTIGLIRGEQHNPLNATLSYASECGMQLHYLNRTQYRQKNEMTFLKSLEQQYGKVYILPEGGSNRLALDGCKEIVQEVSSELADELDRPFDVICCASGTGATLAGLALAIETEKTAQQQTAIGFSVLKGDPYLTTGLATEVRKFLTDKNTGPAICNWYIESGFHFGGYAKITDELIQFMQAFQSQYNIALDAVYTAKMFYGLFELIKSGTFVPGTIIVAVHSGGLQGNKGFDL
jgi:1-aminocyclopropane-1-carboxylate deaminase/D-cysteine desulfhydrase-like pyridoxal-dependent ACC family enzyme